MHLQLVGRLDPNESYAIFNIENVTNLISGNWINLEILNLIICHSADHNHFEEIETAPYPIDPSRYKEKIFVKIPKPRQVAFRRRTFQLTDVVPYPTSGQLNRARRARRSKFLEPLQMEYSAIFKSNIHRYDIADFPNNSVSRVIEKLAHEQRPRIVNHFQNLFKSWPSYEIINLPTRRGQNRVKITLPPQTRFMSASKEFFVHLGLATQIVSVSVQNQSYWALVNASRDDAKIFQSDQVIETTMKFSYLYENENCPQSLRIHFMRFPDTFQSTLVTFEESSLCRDYPPAAQAFLQQTLLCIEEFMALPANCLKAILTDGYVEIKKAPEFHNAADSTNNFSLIIRLGEKVQELLGFVDSSITWTLGRTDQKYRLVANVSTVDAQTCNTIITEVLPNNFNNQSGNWGPLVQARQDKWQLYLNERAERQRQEEDRKRAEQMEADLLLQKFKEARQEQETLQESETVVEEETTQTVEPVQQQEEEEEEPRVEMDLTVEREKTLEDQIVLTKQALQRVILDVEQAQDYIDTLERDESERRKNNLVQLERENNEMDDMEREASLLAAAGQTDEARVLVEKWKQLKLYVENERFIRRQNEEEHVTSYQKRLEDSKQILQNLVEDRRRLEEELHRLKTTRLTQIQEQADADAESQRGRQQLLEELEAEEAQLLAAQEDDDDDGADDENYFVQVEIDNPNPRPPSYFPVANHERKHICTQPDLFPEHCTILIKEGEPTDYVASRGLCCVMGIIRKTLPNIVSNKCIIKRFQTLKYLSLEFVDESLNTFKIDADSRPMWLKIDVSCNTYF